MTDEILSRIAARNDDPAVKTLVETVRLLRGTPQAIEATERAIVALTLERPDPVENFKRTAARVAVDVFGNRIKAAKRLRVARSTLYEWLQND
jgi:transcriptional regulator with PAS, ATPase and Fis domain